MKKLMIAAAAAAMIGGVQAADVAYDFVANLQTTTGETVEGVDAGEDTYVFGDNGGTGGLWASTYKYWYNSTNVLENVDGVAPNYTWKTNATQDIYRELEWYTHDMGGGRLVPALRVATDDGQVTNAAAIAWLDQLWTEYGYGNRKGLPGPSKTECCSLTVSYKAGGCYRVAGSNFIQERLYLGTNDCCSAAAGTFTNVALTASIGVSGLATNSTTFLNRYGSYRSDRADQIEILADIVAPTKAGYHGEYVVFHGQIAGQGNCQVLDDDEKELAVKIPNQIQGNIVGYLEFSLCDVCCDVPLATRAFQCLRLPFTDEIEAQTLKTAAFGTFYLNRVD